MGWVREALQLSPLLFSWILAAVLLLSPEAHADAVVRFLETPPAFSAVATATFKFEVADEKNCTACGSCSLSCMLDNSSCFGCESKEVTYSCLLDGNHMFVVCVNGSQRVRCASYNWTVDTVAPTAYISAASSFTNASNVSVMISFSEPCTGGGGFRCSSAYCSLLVYGAGHVLPSTLKVTQPDLDFSLMVSISEDVQFGRLVLVMDKGFCEDNAKNSFRQTSNSSFTLHFDRRSVFVNLTTNVPQKLIPFGGELRTAEATNTAKDLKIYLSFSQPVLNSSDEILHLLRPTGGLLVPANRNDHGNRRFEYLVQNVSARKVIAISCDTTRIICRHGTPVSPSEAIAFLYGDLDPYSSSTTYQAVTFKLQNWRTDDQRPSVRLSTTSNMRSREHKIAVLVQFAKPVFDFNYSAAVVSGGHMLRFHEISKTKYEIEIHPNDSIVSVQVPENKTADIAGNLNLPSNILQVEHYSVPTISSIVSITSSAALAITSMIAALLTVSTSSLISSGVIFREKSYLVSEPSRNLVRLVCHIQVFALCRWLVMAMPNEYSEFSMGIEWTIPYISLPWKEGSNYEDSTVAHNPNSEAWESSRFKIFKYPSFTNQTIKKNPSVRGRPFTEGEYVSFFQDMKPLAEPISQILNRWRNFGKNIFWLAVLGAGLILLHVAILGVLKLKRKNSEKQKEYGALVFPRFEMFLIQLALPCICQASGAIIKGGNSTGAVVGAVLLGITACVLISMLLFLSFGITRGKLLQYKEIHREGQEFHRYQEFVRVTLGPGKRGQWTWKDQQNSVNQTILGPLFEDLRGPPKYKLTQIAGGGSQAKREDRIIASEDENEDAEAPFIQKLFGILRIYYPFLESAKRVTLGVLAGVYSSSSSKPSRKPSLIILAITSFQLCFLVLKKPFIKKKVQFVEIISVACEAGLFAACLVLSEKKPNRPSKLSGAYERRVGLSMVAMFIVMFTTQMLNELLALYRQVLRLGPSRGSFSSGLKSALGGLALIPLPASMSTKLIEQLASSQGEGDSGNTVSPLSRAQRPSGTSERSWLRQLRELGRASFSRDDAGPPNDPSSSTRQANRFWNDKRSRTSSVTSSSDFKTEELRAKSGGLFKDLEATFSS